MPAGLSRSFEPRLRLVLGDGGTMRPNADGGVSVCVCVCMRDVKEISTTMLTWFPLAFLYVCGRVMCVCVCVCSGWGSRTADWDGSQEENVESYLNAVDRLSTMVAETATETREALQEASEVGMHNTVETALTLIFGMETTVESYAVHAHVAALCHTLSATVS